MRGLADTRSDGEASAGIGWAGMAGAMFLAAVSLGVVRPAEADEPTAGAAAPAASRRWEVHAQTGLQYDSNVGIAPGGQAIPVDPADPEAGRTGSRADGAISLGAGGSVDVVDSDRAQLNLGYDLYQTLHFQLENYDLRSNRVQATGGFALLPQLWLGAQTGFEHYVFGSDAYSREPFLAPFVSYLQGNWGLTQLLYRHGYTSYLQQPFEGIRNGPTDIATLSQTFYWGARYATVGYEFGSERPRNSQGRENAQCLQIAADTEPGQPRRLCPGDYRFHYNQAYVGIGFTPGWRTTFDVMYLFRHENYTQDNSLTVGPGSQPFKRRDDINQVQVGVRRPIGQYFSVGLNYFGTFDNSNISFYTYDRHIVSAEVRVAY
jgi:hypothetical protein